MLKGVALGLLTYGLFSSADALIKSLGGELPVTEIVFLATLTSFIVILILRPRGERWRDMFRMNHPKRVMLRAACGIISGIGATFAFITIRLARGLCDHLPVAGAGDAPVHAPLLGEQRRLGGAISAPSSIGVAGDALLVVEARLPRAPSRPSRRLRRSPSPARPA